MDNLNNSNPFDMGKIVKNEKVVCALLEAGNVQYYSILGGFTGNPATAHFAPKHEIFDRVCEEANWDEICGRVVFLNPKELEEILEDSATKAA